MTWKNKYGLLLVMYAMMINLKYSTPFATWVYIILFLVGIQLFLYEKKENK
jgi:hypothetical protein